MLFVGSLTALNFYRRNCLAAHVRVKKSDVGVRSFSFTCALEFLMEKVVAFNFDYNQYLDFIYPLRRNAYPNSSKTVQIRHESRDQCAQCRCLCTITHPFSYLNIFSATLDISSKSVSVSYLSTLKAKCTSPIATPRSLLLENSATTLSRARNARS